MGNCMHNAYMEKDLFDNLNKNERKIIIECWPEYLVQHRDLFLDAWIEAVDQNPEMKTIFGLRHYSDPRLCNRFVNLAGTVEAFFNRLVVSLLLDERLVTEESQSLGARHAKHQTRKGFQPIHWDIFALCLMEKIEKTHMSLSARKRAKFVFAWQKLVTTVVRNMRIGYDLGVLTMA